MPIFEYKCGDCNKKFEVLHKSSVNQEEVYCPECNSKNYKKLLSAFSASVNGSSDNSSYDNSCSSGNCGLPTPNSCSAGMCGLN